MTLAQTIQIPYSKAVVAAADSLGAIIIEELIQILEDEWLATYYNMSSHTPNVTVSGTQRPARPVTSM